MAKKDRNSQEQPQPGSHGEMVDSAVEQQILNQLRILDETPERDPARAAKSFEKIVAATANKRKPGKMWEKTIALLVYTGGC